MSDTKYCPKCKKVKLLSEFYKDKRAKRGCSSWCKTCTRVGNKAYASTPEGKKSRKESLKRHFEKRGGKRYRSDQNRLLKYGISPQEYDGMYQEQQGCCAICGTHQSEFGRALAVDHDHKTKIIRGLLCANCNSAIGKLKDNPVLLRKAADYLEGLI